MTRLKCYAACWWAAACVAVADGGSAPPPWKQRLLPKNDAWRQTTQELVINNGAEPESLDPGLITGVPEMRLARALFEGLVALDPETLEPRPALAAHWTVDEEGQRYVFRLREDARWSNGAAVTADDVYRSWKRVLTPATGAPYAYQLYPVVGAEAYHRGTTTDFAQVGVRVLGDHRLEVRLHSPCSYFLDLAAFPTLFPVPTAAIAAHGDRWVLPEHIVGNGPFVLSEWRPRQHLVLTPNPYYWDRATCKLKRVTMLPYDDLDTAYKLYLQGKMHWLPAIPLPKLDEIKRNPDYYVMPYLGTYFYRFNVTRKPFDDVRVRRAFSLAVDRRVITDQVLRGGQRPAGYFCPPVAGYKPIDGVAYAPQAARKLLREAGYGEGGKPLPTVEILYNTNESHRQVAEAVAQQWKRNLGVTVSLRNTEWKVYLSDLDNLNYQIGRSGWIGDYGDPNTFFDMWVTDGGNNRTGWANADYDALLRRSQASRSPAERHALFQQMEKLLVLDSCPILPIYIYVNQGLLSESVCGWYENVRDIHPLKYVWLEE